MESLGDRTLTNRLDRRPASLVVRSSSPQYIIRSFQYFVYEPSEGSVNDGKRRHLHQLIERAANRGSVACFAVEQMIFHFGRKRATDDAAIILAILRCLAPEHVYQEVVFRLPGRERYPDPKDWFL